MVGAATSFPHARRVSGFTVKPFIAILPRRKPPDAYTTSATSSKCECRRRVCDGVIRVPPYRSRVTSAIILSIFTVTMVIDVGLHMYPHGKGPHPGGVGQ